MHLYNTRTRKKEEFTPLRKEVRIYTCGPTVYNYAHIGNLRAFIMADLVKRTLLFLDYDVKHVMNITDVGHLTSDADEGEDKMLKGAKRENITVWDIAKKYTEAFMEDMKGLHLLKPDVMPKATDHIKEMIAFIQTLEEKGYTYQAGGNVYFNTQKFSDYTAFAHLPDVETTEERVEKDENKQHPRDFVLWFTKSKFQEQDMKWDSPWGVGYPGWHIECSVMSTKYLGEQFDIHTGGIDHIPVHHTNEIAQSECCFGNHPWVRMWMHSAFLKMGEEKMAKSGDNFLTLSVLKEKGFDALHYRFFTYTAHYRKPLSFSWDGLEAAKRGYERLKKRVIELKREGGTDGSVKKHEDAFSQAIEDDINMPQAVAAMWELLDDRSIGGKKKYETLLHFDDVLGLEIEYMEERNEQLPQEIAFLAQTREQARKEKDFQKADELRNQIEERGYVVEDTDEGQKVRKQ